MKTWIAITSVILSLAGTPLASAATLDIKTRARSVEELAILLHAWNPTISEKSALAMLKNEIQLRGVNVGVVQPAILLADLAAMSGEEDFANLLGPVISSLNPIAGGILHREFQMPRTFDEAGIPEEDIRDSARNALPKIPGYGSITRGELPILRRLRGLDESGIVNALLGPGSFINAKFKNDRVDEIDQHSPILSMSSVGVKECIYRCRIPAADAAGRGSASGASIGGTIGVTAGAIGGAVGGAGIGAVPGAIEGLKDGILIGGFAGGVLGGVVGFADCAAEKCQNAEVKAQVTTPATAGVPPTMKSTQPAPVPSPEPQSDDLGDGPIRTGPGTPTAGGGDDSPVETDDGDVTTDDKCKTKNCDVARVMPNEDGTSDGADDTPGMTPKDPGAPKDLERSKTTPAIPYPTIDRLPVINPKRPYQDGKQGGR